MIQENQPAHLPETSNPLMENPPDKFPVDFPSCSQRFGAVPGLTTPLMSTVSGERRGEHLEARGRKGPRLGATRGLTRRPGEIASGENVQKWNCLPHS